MSDEERPDQFVDRLCRAIDRHDLDALVACFADGYVNETPAHPAQGFVGAEQVRRNWTQIFAAVPDITASVRRRVSDGNTVWSEWEMHGTRPDGAPHDMRGVVIFEILAGQATAARFYLEPVEHRGPDADRAARRAVGTTPGTTS